MRKASDVVAKGGIRVRFLKAQLKKIKNLILVLPVVLALPAVTTVAQPCATVTNSFSFNGNNGSGPNFLLLGTDGNFYGTTAAGGTNGNFGTIFQFNTNGALKTLFSFNGANGSDPIALSQGEDGRLYGTTAQGGISNLGTAFKITTQGAFTSLLSFTGANGAFPYTRLVPDPAGHGFIGTTLIGGSSQNSGTIFRMSTNGALSTLATFNGSNGSFPYGGVTLGPDGSFYGTTSQGGSNENNGTVYKVDAKGNVVTLFSFDYANSGAGPFAQLLLASDGFLYGTTSKGGPNGVGTLFKSDTNGNLITLVSFNNTNGANPQTQLVQDSLGNILGATFYGGTNANDGTLFKISRSGVFRSLYSFIGGVEGFTPYAPLVQTPDGNFYGTAYNGGTNASFGTIFRFTLQTAPASRPMLILNQLDSSSISFAWDSVPGLQYQLQSTTLSNNFTSANWTNLGPAITAASTNTTSSVFTSTNPQVFYRLQVIQ